MAQYRAAILSPAPIQSQAQADDLNRLLDAHKQRTRGGPVPRRRPPFLGAFTILVPRRLEALLIVVANDRLPSQGRIETTPCATCIRLDARLAAVSVTWAWQPTSYRSAVRAGSHRGLIFAIAGARPAGRRHLDASEECRWPLAGVFARQTLGRALDRRIDDFLIRLSFIAVYREVFETILFYAALWTEGQSLRSGAGLFAGTLALVAVAWILSYQSPAPRFGNFFAASSLVARLRAGAHRQGNAGSARKPAGSPHTCCVSENRLARCVSLRTILERRKR